MKRTLLGVWAHPDDEVFLSSALMLAARACGERVVVVTATPGERGTDDPARWPPDRLADLRAHELTESLALLDVREHHWLGYADGACALVPEATATDAVAAIIDEVRPDTIVTFGPDGLTGHPDHRAVARWTQRARALAAPDAALVSAVLPPGFTRRFADINTRFGIFMDTPDDQAEPDLHLHLHGPPLDRKIAAMLAQPSQTRRLAEGVGLARFRQWWAAEAFHVAEPAATTAA